jgi:hypothetical protein
MPKNASHAWTNAPQDQLFTVPELDDTPLRAIPRRTRYALISSGALESVVVGERRYVTKAAISNFIRSHAKTAAG